MYLQPLLPLPGGSAPVRPAAEASTGTFADNMRLPVHRWFRYSAGFSATWAQELIEARRPREGQIVLDPFAGSGTTLLAAQDAGVESVGVEAHAFVARVADAKLCRSTEPAALRDAAAALLAKARRGAPVAAPADALLSRCYSADALGQLLALRQAWSGGDGPVDRLLWLAITAILRECSGVGTAQWQYVLPNKSKRTVRAPFEAFVAKVDAMAADLSSCANLPAACLIHGDARTVASQAGLAGTVGLVVTSPPYPNNFDYADATRLEMTFWGEIGRWGDLHSTVRRHLVTSCSQHSAADKLKLEELLELDGLAPIRDELSQVCRELAAVRETRGGRKTYHTMVAAYFRDLGQVWQALRTVCAEGSAVCFVIGDSAPYGVHVPVERWLGTLAVSAGFGRPTFDKLRDRNTKWKNRKHRVPLHEGRLWLEG